ncbi:MAG: nitroreductase [Pseudonocardia sp.]|nr:nitroreductase [Pseudonocardia sp.]
MEQQQDTTSEFGSALGLDHEQVLAVLTMAGRAPSLHNTQPWRFGLRPDAIEVVGDRDRQLSVADPAGRELRIACGAALFTLRLALIGLGIRPLVSVLPEADRPDLIATVRHGGRKSLTPELSRLRDAIPHRRTNRRPFTDVAVSSSARHAMCRAAVEEGAWLHLVTDPAQRHELGTMAREAHTRQIQDPAFSAEIATWTGHDGSRDDGVPASAGGPLPAPNQTWVTRDFTGGQASGAGSVFEDEPLIGVLSVHGDGAHEEIRAGQALQRVLLTATVHGVAVSFLSQLVEVPETRDRMRRLISGTRPPLVVLRMGHGLPAGGAPRRRVSDLTVGGATPTS